MQATMARPSAGKVLVVEDDAAVREAIVDVLLDEGYDVAATENGRAALDWLAQNPAPHAIILDLWMPVMDGMEFREAQLRDHALAEIPVVMVTAARDRSRVEPRLRPTEYLEKPLQVQTLLVALERCVATTRDAVG
jgi:CheY-like chemotaxis protein